MFNIIKTRNQYLYKGLNNFGGARTSDKIDSFADIVATTGTLKKAINILNLLNEQLSKEPFTYNVKITYTIEAVDVSTRKNTIEY
ncbi:hypothetical protein [Lactobacillus terrae]|uniref:hypothetical protein n=1 Tax=Lactobacillus terrae TaxID=2269374 RepID=UPI000C1B607B|nr:hypothetical protein [Lactobacillus terrae]